MLRKICRLLCIILYKKIRAAIEINQAKLKQYDLLLKHFWRRFLHWIELSYCLFYAHSNLICDRERFFVTWLSNWFCVAYSLKNQFTSMSFNSLEGVALTVVVYGIKKFVIYNFSTRRDVKHAHWLIIWKYFFYYRYHKNNLSFYDLLIVNRLVLLAATTCAVRNFTCDTLWISKIVYVNVNFTSSQSVS